MIDRAGARYMKNSRRHNGRLIANEPSYKTNFEDQELFKDFSSSSTSKMGKNNNDASHRTSKATEHNRDASNQANTGEGFLREMQRRQNSDIRASLARSDYHELPEFSPLKNYVYYLSKARDYYPLSSSSSSKKDVPNYYPFQPSNSYKRSNKWKSVDSNESEEDDQQTKKWRGIDTNEIEEGVLDQVGCTQLCDGYHQQCHSAALNPFDVWRCNRQRWICRKLNNC